MPLPNVVGCFEFVAFESLVRGARLSSFKKRKVAVNRSIPVQVICMKVERETGGFDGTKLPRKSALPRESDHRTATIS